MFKSKWILHFWQAVLLAVIFVAWWALTKPGLIPPFIFENDTQAAFFFGEPVEIFHRIWDWFFVNHDALGNGARIRDRYGFRSYRGSLAWPQPSGGGNRGPVHQGA